MAQVRIFVSHSSHDNAWCRPFADALKAVGYDVWYDETGLQGGAAWVDSIQREVENRDVFLLVLTPEAWSSKWVQDELQLAIATRRRILPVLLRNTQVSGFLLTTQWVTVIGEEPQAAARAAIMAIEAPPAPGRNATPQATSETLDDLITLCKSLAAENRYTEALSACVRALSLAPDNIEVLWMQARVLGTIGEVDRQVQVYTHLLLIMPPGTYFVGDNFAEVKAACQTVLTRSNDLSTMVEVYRRVYGNETQDHEMLEILLSRLLDLNHPEDAIELITYVKGRAGVDVIERILDWRTKDEREQLEFFTKLAAKASNEHVRYAATEHIILCLYHLGEMEPLRQLVLQERNVKLHRSAMSTFLSLVAYQGRFDILESFTEFLINESDRKFRYKLLSEIVNMHKQKANKVAVVMCEAWFGYPPDRARAGSPIAADSDVYALGAYSFALMALGRKQESQIVDQYIARLQRADPQG